jgi:hypothetical protein
MTRFYYAQELHRPEDVKPYLADVEHWRPGFSACELATAWIRAENIPGSVRTVLNNDDVFAGCRLVEAYFERRVDLLTPGRPSQTDLLALVQLAADGYGVIAVEGKAREPFGQVVSEWNDGPGKQRRLDDLCARLGLEPAAASDLRYQLLHRTVAALLEAKRFGAREAMMLVHSFDPDDSSLSDYRRFAERLGLRGAEPNRVTGVKVLAGVTLRLGWVKQL